MSQGISLSLDQVSSSGEATFIVRGDPPQSIRDVASYYSREDLEDMDVFDSEPGWKLGLSGVLSLYTQDFIFEVDGTSFTTPEAFEAEWGKAAMQRKEAEQEDAERRREEDRQVEQERREQQGRVYAAWRTALTAGLVRLERDYLYPQLHTLGWVEIRNESNTSPGTWYTTGDRWSRAILEGQAVYRHEYGSGTICFLPRDSAAVILRVWWDARQDKARTAVDVLGSIMIDNKGGIGRIYGDNDYRLLIDVYSLEYFIAAARQEPVQVVISPNVSDYYRDNRAVAERFGLPILILHSTQTNREVTDDQGEIYIWSDGKYRKHTAAVTAVRAPSQGELR